MKLSSKNAGWFIAMFILAPLVIWFYNEYGINRNRDIELYLPDYTSKIKQIEVYVPKFSQEELRDGFRIHFSSYQRGVSLIGYKAVLGDIYSYYFRDTISSSYFKIFIFDNDRKMESLDYVIEDSRIFLYVNSDDLSNPTYGSKEKPIPAFSFKGVDEPIAVTSESKDAVDGMKSLEPTPKEFEHNVRSYLTYIMSKEEFNARFRKEKN